MHILIYTAFLILPSQDEGYAVQVTGQTPGWNASTVGDPLTKKNKDKIESVQRRAPRFVT